MSDCYTIQEFHKEKVNFTNITIMQFTGLKDKNGTEIYEGDILSYDYSDSKDIKDWMLKPFAEVKYHKDYFVGGDGLDKEKKCFMHGFRFQYTDIVGNIYQNPELIPNP